MQLSFVSGRFAGIIQDEKLQNKNRVPFSGLCFCSAVQDIQAYMSLKAVDQRINHTWSFRSLLDANHAHSPVNAPVRIPLMVSIGR